MELLEPVFNIITAFITDPINTLVTGILSYMPVSSVQLPYGLSEFLPATIKAFVPYQQIIACITMQIPFIIANIGVKLLLRVKSFIPTMGGI